MKTATWLLVLSFITLPAFAQAPGGRGGAPTNAPATLAQRNAYLQMEATLAPLATAVTDARSALVAASLADPANADAVRSAAAAVSAAELQLANARSNAIAGLLTGPNALNAAQLEAVRNRAAGGGGRGGGVAGADLLNPDPYAGFESIFDGATLTNWDGAPGLWTVEDGAITARNGGIVGTTYLIWTGGRVRDFELKLEYKIDGGNTGLQYRSRRNGGMAEGHGGHLPDVTPEAARGRPGAQPTPPFGRGRAGADAFARWDLGGYQFDLGGANTGQLYEQDGRGIVVRAGQVGLLVPGLTRAGYQIIGTLGDTSNVDRPGEWNTIHLIARGNSLTHIVNGVLMSQTYDMDPDYFAAEGNLAVQIEGNGYVQYRNIYLKRL
jgi:hypothetical protein